MKCQHCFARLTYEAARDEYFVTRESKYSEYAYLCQPGLKHKLLDVDKIDEVLYGRS